MHAWKHTRLNEFFPEKFPKLIYKNCEIVDEFTGNFCSFHLSRQLHSQEPPQQSPRRCHCWRFRRWTSSNQSSPLHRKSESFPWFELLFTFLVFVTKRAANWFRLGRFYRPLGCVNEWVFSWADSVQVLHFIHNENKQTVREKNKRIKVTFDESGETLKEQFWKEVELPAVTFLTRRSH